MRRSSLVPLSIWSAADRRFMEPIDSAARSNKRLTVHATAFAILPPYKRGPRRMVVQTFSLGEFTRAERAKLTAHEAQRILESRRDLHADGWVFVSIEGLTVIRGTARRRPSSKIHAPRYFSLGGVKLPRFRKGRPSELSDAQLAHLRDRAASVRRGASRPKKGAKKPKRPTRGHGHGVRVSKRPVSVRAGGRGKKGRPSRKKAKR